MIVVRLIKFIPWFFLIQIFGMVQAQSGFPKYNEFSRLYSRGDSCYNSGNYKLAGDLFLQAASMEVEKGIELSRGDMYILTSVAYALAGENETALRCLRVAAFDFGFSSVETLSDSSFIQLRSLDSWNEIERQVAGNFKHRAEMDSLFKRRTTPGSALNETVFYPVRSDYLRQVFSLDTLPFISVNHGIFRLYFSADSYVASNLPEIKMQLDDALSRALEILGTPVYRQGINILFFNSVEEMKVVTGIRAMGGVAYPEDHLAFFPYTEGRRFQLRHELFHVISVNLWGPPTCRLMMEGSAVFADNQCHIENPIPTINAYYLKYNELYPVDSLLNQFDILAQASDVKVYLQSAGIFKYIYDRFGYEKTKALWREGFGKIEELLGVSVEGLQKDYREYLRRVTIPEGFSDTILEKGCG